MSQFDANDVKDKWQASAKSSTLIIQRGTPLCFSVMSIVGDDVEIINAVADLDTEQNAGSFEQIIVQVSAETTESLGDDLKTLAGLLAEKGTFRLVFIGREGQEVSLNRAHNFDLGGYVCDSVTNVGGALSAVLRLSEDTHDEQGPVVMSLLAAAVSNANLDPFDDRWQAGWVAGKSAGANESLVAAQSPKTKTSGKESTGSQRSSDATKKPGRRAQYLGIAGLTGLAAFVSAVVVGSVESSFVMGALWFFSVLILALCVGIALLVFFLVREVGRTKRQLDRVARGVGQNKKLMSKNQSLTREQQTSTLRILNYLVDLRQFIKRSTHDRN